MTTSVEIYDTTLRDGTQQEGISLTAGDKLRMRSKGRLANPLPAKYQRIVAGKVKEAIELDGKGDHVNVAGASQILRSGVDGVTMAAWIRSSSGSHCSASSSP